ncbi:calcium/sodium antiporter, partial [Patescibacteria group bacterium]|nr:calcium/sodium antiporter [Patescibacteria group bacterium]
MEIIFSLFFIALGVLILLKGANWLVSGASSIASLLRVEPIVIGLTVVAFGTSSPELVVSIISAISGNTNIALGSIIGSNIANILLILGLSAVIYPIHVKKNTAWKEIPMSFLGGIILVVLALRTLIDSGTLRTIPFSGNEIIGIITASNGIVLLSFFIIFLYYTFGIARTNETTNLEIEKKSALLSTMLVLIGLGGLIIGSKLLVENGISIARAIGVSDSFIGLTLVSIGTSLPELVTCLVAASRKKMDIAIGGIIGSNIFNIFFVLGTTSLIRPIPLPALNLIDIFVLFASTLLLFMFLFVM